MKSLLEAAGLRYRKREARCVMRMSRSSYQRNKHMGFSALKLNQFAQRAVLLVDLGKISSLTSGGNIFGSALVAAHFFE